MNSCLYAGHVRHRRFQPIHNEFRYALCLLYLDLDELPGLFDAVGTWSLNRFNLASFYRSDYVAPHDRPIADVVRERIQAAVGTAPAGPIRMLTHGRYWGYCFNPVTFYYCFSADGTELECVLAEITNTPWGERHSYVCHKDQNEGTIRHQRYRFAKRFHVSPFMDMNLDYDWRFHVPGEQLNVFMRSNEEGTKVFDALLTTERQALTPTNLRRVLWRYPLMTLKVVSLIHWQALKLWWKGATFYTHPEKRELLNKE